MIKSNEYKGKNLDLLLEQISTELLLPLDQINYKVASESSLFSKSFTVHVYQESDIIDYLKTTLLDLLTNIGLTDINIEILGREHATILNIMTNNNAVIIGKDGRNLDALQFYLRNVLHNQGLEFNFLLDIENYKQKKQKKIVRLAHSLADDAIQTGTEVVMRNLNAFERRLVHQELSKSDLIKTHSEGEGINRNLIITPKEKV